MGMRTARILAVDDEPGILRAIERVLSGDHHVVGTRLSLDALSVAQEFHPDLAIVDIRMPDLDGLGALRELSRRGASTKIIVLTASEDQVEYAQAITDGAAGVMLKGSAVDMLAGCIRSVCSGEIWLDTEALPLPCDMDEMSPVVLT